MTISNSNHSKHHDRLGYSYNDSEDKTFVSAAYAGGHFQHFDLDSGFGTYMPCSPKSDKIVCSK